jgi:DNA-binding NarL/FixJ family response regulator
MCAEYRMRRCCVAYGKRNGTMEASRKRILCIDDDCETAALIAEELGDRGYEVCLAHDGGVGLDAILRSPPHLVLADVNMPVMSGFDLLRHVTTLEPRFTRMPFIFLTALADHDNELRGWQLGADDYVTKPVDFDLLAAVIASRLTRVARSAVWPRLIDLGERERETLTWAARGKTFAEIGEILGLSRRTVEFHLDNARRKLGVPTRTQALIKAAIGQLIEP